MKRIKWPTKNFVLEAEMFYPCGMSHASNGNGHSNGAYGNGIASPVPKKIAKIGAAKKIPEIKENTVRFVSAEGVVHTAVPVRFLRHAAVVEMLGGSGAVQVSEVLRDFEISIQAEKIYSGRAVVSRLVDGGSKTTCEVTLDEAGWADLDLMRAIQQAGGIENEFRKFLRGWQEFYKISPDFKVAAINLLTFFEDSIQWLERVSVAAQRQGRPNWEQELFGQLGPEVFSSTLSINERFEEALNRLEPAQLPAHQAFCRRLLHPVTMCSPFMHRAYHKPLGYAGDYEMVNMMFRNPFEGELLFAKLLNYYALHLPPIVGHRNRIDYLGVKLEKESLRVIRQKCNLRVFSMGCGPAQEVQRFLKEDDLADFADFTLADFEGETIQRTGKLLENLRCQHARKSTIKMTKQSVQQLLRAAERKTEYAPHNQHDLIYCAGLFDYLSDQVCKQLMEVFYAMLAPGGMLISTNVDNHRARHQMECFLDWHLVYRNADQMKELVPTKAGMKNATIKYDPSGVNVFLEIRKATGE